MNGVRLLPEMDVEAADGRWLARSPGPWLAAPALLRHAGHWLGLRYHAGLFDELVRPLIRFRLADGGEEIVPMNGALEGVGEWIGRVPDGTVAVALSPVRRAGPFGFVIVDARRVARTRLVLLGFGRRPRMALTALGARLIGSRGEARHCLKFAALPTPLSDHRSWSARRRRGIEPESLDRLPEALGRGPTLHFLAASSDQAAAARTLASLQAQSYPRWRLLVPGASPVVTSGAEPRLALVAAGERIAALGGRNDLLAVIEAGDEFLPQACAHVAAAMAGTPAARACYGDEEDAGGGPPRLKPDFGPVFQAATGYVGAGAFVRLEALAAAGAAALREAAALPFPAFATGEVVHVRRLVYRRRFRPARIPAAVSSPEVASRPEVAVIVPTRDRPALLGTCLAALRERTDYPGWRLVLVDNGTTDARALALIAEAAARPGTVVLREPGPFNYAALCNAGAAATQAPVLAFLNNDVTPLAPDWLGRLVAWAMRPEIGAVGPKLLFPDGRVQHGGDVLGLGETALHAFYRAADRPGYLGQLGAPREVAAVTGAVQVVERAKFDAVGGFDAEAFPVLLNDTDLCLRLAARGWTALYEPGAVMIHAESASRGRSARPFTLYGRERRAFAARWMRAVRDDPCFHPALSLYAEEPALG